MAIGKSGRFIIEVDPEFKKEFYDALKKEDLTLKEWFLNNAGKFLKDRGQLNLLLTDDESSKRVN